jgi:SAM-dependent methyltransferase
MSVAAGTIAEPRYAAAPRLPRYCTSLVNRVSDLVWERKLGIATRGIFDGLHPDGNRYGYLAFHTYFSIFDRWGLTTSDVVVDLGCGKGRVVCAAAQYAVREVVGVEIDPQLAAAAKANAARLRRRRAAVRIVEQSAVDFDYAAVTAIVMFHPFGAETMRQVLDRLERSLVEYPRKLRIAYANPVLTSLLAERPWLKREERLTPTTWSRVKFPIDFYGNRHV